MAGLQSDVEFLTSDACAGRAPGTDGGRLARGVAIDRFTDLGLAPAGEGGHIHEIPSIGGANILARVEGSGRPDRHVLLGAHYDHLGTWGGEIYRGADDNASGVAVMLDVARRLAQEPQALGRSVLLCAFDAEEPPNYLTPTMGSIAWVSDPTVPLESIDQMICLDIVGRRLGGFGMPDDVGESIFALGGERSSAGEILDANADGRDVRLRRADADLIPPLSDYFAFEMAEIPFVFFTCGRSWRYHTPDDTPDHLDYDKMAGFSELLTDIVVDLSTAEIGGYRVGGRDDAATLRSLGEMLESLARVDPEAEVALERIESADAELGDDGRLPDEVHTEIGALLLTLEAAIESQ